MDPVRRAALLAALLAVAALAAAGTAGAAVHWKTFRTPSKNIGCRYEPAPSFFRTVLRCDILSGLQPQPSKDCELDWAGLMIQRRHRVHLVCAGDTAYPPHGRILRYGHHWRRHGIACVSRRTALRCHNRSHHGFRLARESWYRF